MLIADLENACGINGYTTGGGYNCPSCGVWVFPNALHSCFGVLAQATEWKCWHRWAMPKLISVADRDLLIQFCEHCAAGRLVTFLPDGRVTMDDFFAGHPVALPITIHIHAMNSKSILERSNEIADAVRKALVAGDRELCVTLAEQLGLR